MVKIIDASVAIKWFVIEKGQTQSLKVLQGVLENPTGYAVPELFYFELIHIFNRLIPAPNKGQLTLLDQIIKIGIKRFKMTNEICKNIRKFQHKGLSGYDAAYVALASLLKGKWLTFDKKAHSKISTLGLSLLLKA